MRLLDASFEIPRMLAEIGAREGRVISVAGVHSIAQTNDGEASVYLDLMPVDANQGTGVLIVNIDAKDALYVDHETILEAISNEYATLH